MSSRTDAGRGVTARPVVVGHPTAPIGMGEHMRSVWRSLDEVGLDPGVMDVFGPQANAQAAFMEMFRPATVDRLGRGVNIYCINGDEVGPALAHMRDRDPFAPGSYNIIYPAWELERYPAEWASELARFDEVWAESMFVHDAIAAALGARAPVVHMPLACKIRTRALRSRRHFGIRESAYVFLFAFDYLSYVERKNPFAVIEAFRRVVELRPFADVSLVVKTNNSHERPEMSERVLEAVKPLKDHLVMIDGTLSDIDMKSLLWLCDCYLSLHRSEGFGFGLSESMAMGKPVIATAYSGNMDFCTAADALLVPFDLVPLREGDYPHWRDQRWAAPHVDAAVQAMLKLIDDPAEGRAIGARARLRIEGDFSHLAAGRRYADRLAEIAGS